MGPSYEARILKDIAKSLRLIFEALAVMNNREEQKYLAQFGTPGFSLRREEKLDIPESCPKERRWTEPAAAAACNTCRRYWACPYCSDEEGEK